MNSCRRPSPIIAALLFVCAPLAALLLAPSAALAGPHPRLLITPADLPRIRHACGVARSDDASKSPWGGNAGDYQALRNYFSPQVREATLPGELLAIGFLHLVDPSDPQDGTRIEMLNQRLRASVLLPEELLECAIALDWCWAALDAGARDAFLANIRRGAQPLTPMDAPLDPRVFYRKLAALAVAVAVDRDDDPSITWSAVRDGLFKSAAEYNTQVLPNVLAAHGGIPSSPTNAADEECGAALLLELLARGPASDVWRLQGPTVGRWLEHYLFERVAAPGMRRQIARDDCRQTPGTPAGAWDGLHPLTAHLLAARTRDPAATALAIELTRTMRGDDPLLAVWRWLPIALPVEDIAAANTAKLPALRDLDGAVVLRAGEGLGEVAVWIDAGQNYVQRRQHFDAGSFVVRCGGQLVIDAGDDIKFEATTGKGGKQMLGDREFDFEQYFAATLAHNCVLLVDPAKSPTWYEQPYAPVGGQRLIEQGLRNYDQPTPLDRETSRLIATGQERGAAYVSLDLAPAYNPEQTTAYTREFVFWPPGVLVIVDRFAPALARIEPTWLLQLPVRPEVDGKDLTDAARLRGATNDGGVWRYPGGQTLHWTVERGQAWLTPVSPENLPIVIAGGPAERLTIEHGPYAGRTYMGGSEVSFERLVRPALDKRAENAWYRLDAPTLLGDTVGTVPQWGRIELSPPAGQRVVTMVNVLVFGPTDANWTPTIKTERQRDSLRLTTELDAETATLTLPLNTRGGKLERGEAAAWTLPGEIEKTEPLPTLPR